MEKICVSVSTCLCPSELGGACLWVFGCVGLCALLKRVLSLHRWCLALSVCVPVCLCPVCSSGGFVFVPVPIWVTVLV